jgi:hypothetical protein
MIHESLLKVGLLTGLLSRSMSPSKAVALALLIINESGEPEEYLRMCTKWSDRKIQAFIGLYAECLARMPMGEWVIPSVCYSYESIYESSWN